jgi:hypothetical protein
MMKFISSMFSALCVFLTVTGVYGNEQTFKKGPLAFVTTPIYEFEPVVDGTKVFHDFIIRNRGTAPLEVQKVKTP